MSTKNLLNNPDYVNALLAGTAKSSRRAYTRDVRYFCSWMKYRAGLAPHYPVSLELIAQFILDHTGHMPPEVETQLIAKGLRRKAGPLRISTLRRYLASLSVAHTEHGAASPINDPQIKLLLRRLQRARVNETSNRKAALTADLLMQLVATCDDSLHGIRDKAILLVGFASGGRRRSELTDLRVNDLQKVTGGYVIRLRHSKTDQEGQGHEVPILGEAATALSAWLIKTGIRTVVCP